MPKVGDLVRVKQKWLEYDDVVEHGCLWMHVGRATTPMHMDGDINLYRSIATGFEWEWWSWEIEEAGE